MKNPSAIAVETGSELSGPALLDALHTRFELMTGTARVKASPQAIRVQKVGRWVVVTVQLPDQDVHVRMSSHWTAVLHRELSKVVR